MKHKLAAKIEIGEEGTMSGVAMLAGKPNDSRSYLNFTKEAVAGNVGKEVTLFLDHSQSKTLMTVGRAKFTEMVGNKLMFEARLLMEATDVRENVYPRVKEGVLDGVSVGVEFEEYEEKNNGDIVVNKFNIEELSIVPFPAFKKARIKQVFNEEEKKEIHDKLKALFCQAGVMVKDKVSIEDLSKLTKRDFETILNTIGFSNSVAEKLSCVQGDLEVSKKQGELVIDDLGVMLSKVIEENK